MNYLGPKQHVDGGWHYGSANRRTGVYAIGYCAEHAPHATEAEARECYAQYQRDQIKFHHGTWSWTGCDIKGCDEPTRSAATSGPYGHASLCEGHLTHEYAVIALHLDGPAGDSWQS